MNPHCDLCGRFMKRVTDGIGMPTLTNFPPDRRFTSGSILYAPFACMNHGCSGRVAYHPVAFATPKQP